MKLFKKKQTTSEKPAPKAPSKVLRAFRIAKNIVLGVVFAALVCMVIIILTARINGETPTFFGYTVYRVVSPSMTPYLQVGDIIVTQECDPATLKVGDVITYDGQIGQFAGMRVTHRVVKEPYRNEDNGEYYVLTKGDDNPAEDPPVRLSQVRGKYLQKIDFLKTIYNFFITPWGLLTILALIILAFSNEIYNLIRAALHLDEPREDIQDVIERVQREAAEENKKEE